MQTKSHIQSLKPSISAHSKPRTTPRTRLLKYFVLITLCCKTKHLRSFSLYKVFSFLYFFIWNKLDGLCHKLIVLGSGSFWVAYLVKYALKIPTVMRYNLIKRLSFFYLSIAKSNITLRGYKLQTLPKMSTRLFFVARKQWIKYIEGVHFFTHSSYRARGREKRRTMESNNFWNCVKCREQKHVSISDIPCY